MGQMGLCLCMYIGLHFPRKTQSMANLSKIENLSNKKATLFSKKAEWIWIAYFPDLNLCTYL